MSLLTITKRAIFALAIGGFVSTQAQSTNSVTRIEMINVKTQQIVDPDVKTNKIIDLKALGLSSPTEISFNAITGSITQSVVYALDSNPNFRTESLKPFSFCGDNDGEYLKCAKLTLGKHTALVTPYSGLAATGSAGPTVLLSFEIVSMATAPVAMPIKAPVAVPIKAPVALPIKAPVPMPVKAPVTAPVKPPVTMPVTAPVSVPAPKLSTIRIDTGSSKEVSIGGVQWVGDLRFAPPGEKYVNPICPSIDNTSLDTLFCSERYFPGPKGTVSQFVIPVLPGDYDVTLHFAETYFTMPGERVFGVKVQGRTVKSSLDLISQVGVKKAYKIKMSVIALASIKIEFINIVENAKIDAIEIVPKV